MDNMADKISKGRSNHARGEQINKALLANDIYEIRKMHKEGIQNQKSIAAIYGVSPAMICLILKKERWGHL